MFRVLKAGRARAMLGARQTEARSRASPTRRVLVRRVGGRTARTRDRVNWRRSSASLGPSAPGGAPPYQAAGRCKCSKLRMIEIFAIREYIHNAIYNNKNAHHHRSLLTRGTWQAKECGSVNVDLSTRSCRLRRLSTTKVYIKFESPRLPCRMRSTVYL